MATHTHTTSHYGLAHQFDNMEQQREAGTIGMWIFLVTEVMFFGGLFLAYILFRTYNPVGFDEGSALLNWKLGGTNTIVLIASSLTMALAVYSAQTGNRRMLMFFLVLTILLGLTFLGIKAVEYNEKFTLHHFPGFSNFSYTEHPELATQVRLFLWIYFAMTGLHALHMIIGVGIMSVILFFSW